MKLCIQQNQCRSCNHFAEHKYLYYTHDNRMVECHLYKCGKQETTFLPTHNANCAGWEGQKEILG